MATGPDQESYEAELAEFRRRLQEERKGLNEEIAELRARTRALEAASQAMKQQLAQRWDDLSAERAALDRLRAEGRGQAQQPLPPATPGRFTGTHRLKGTMSNRAAPVPGAAKPASGGRIPRVRLPRRGDS